MDWLRTLRRTFVPNRRNEPVTGRFPSRRSRPARGFCRSKKCQSDFTRLLLRDSLTYLLPRTHRWHPATDPGTAPGSPSLTRRHCREDRFMPRRLSRICLVALLFAASPAVAAPPLDAGERAAVASQPSVIEVTPGSIALSGTHDARQVVVTAKYSDGSVRDLTAIADAKVEPAGVVELQEGVFLRPKKNGTATLVVSAGGKQARVPVTVADMDKPHPVSFRHEVIAALNVGGCNAGACHGTPSGKNGFKLSLRGFDPAADFLQLTRDQFGRRTGKHDPDASLMFLKALGRVPHEGGQRFGATSVPGRDDDGVARGGTAGRRRRRSRRSRRSKCCPARRVLKSPAKWQQLAVVATLRRRHSPRRDPPDRLQQQRPVHRRRDAERPGRVQAARRGRDPVPLPRRADLGPPDLPRTARRLRLAQPAGDELRR